MITRNSLEYYYLCGWKIEIVRDFFDNLRFVINGKEKKCKSECLGKKMQENKTNAELYAIPNL